MQGKLFLIYRVHKKFDKQHIEYMSFDKDECEKIADDLGDSFGYSTGIANVTGHICYLRILKKDFERRKNKLDIMNSDSLGKFTWEEYGKKHKWL